MVDLSVQCCGKKYVSYSTPHRIQWRAQFLFRGILLKIIHKLLYFLMEYPVFYYFVEFK